MAETHRDRLVAAAADLMHANGYAATGVAEILERSGAPKGSLYHHFPGGKEELGIAAVDLAAGRIGAAIDHLLDTHQPADAVRHLGTLLAAGLEATQFQKGCPIATVALETTAQTEPLAAATAEGFARWEASIARAIGGDPERAAADATFVLSGLEGALILARAKRDTAPLHAVAERLATQLEHRTP